MKKVLVIVVLLLAIGIYYKNNTAKVNQWLSQQAGTTIPGTQLSLSNMQSQLTAGWTEDFVRTQLDKFVIKDGIQLPQGWKLDQRKMGGVYFTILIPAQPDGPDDYIAVKVPVANVDLLPTTRLCTKDPATVTCVIGSNLETHRAFSLMTYL